MYSPAHYQVHDQALIREVLTRFNFSTLIFEKEITHLPLFLRGDRLSGHMARNNSFWELAQDKEITCLFHGPHAYISPSWYEDKPSNVPTWNYVAVHVRGTLRLLDGQEAFDSLAQQVRESEAVNGTNWELNRNDSIKALFKSIVVFEVHALRFEAKFKLSQKQNRENRESVIRSLGKGNATGEYMERFL